MASRPTTRPRAMCFFSYSREASEKTNSDWEAQLRASIAMHFKDTVGFDCDIWFDRINIDAGEPHEETIRAEIGNRPIFIPIVSYGWLDGSYCQNEYRLFMERYNEGELESPPPRSVAAIIPLSEIGTEPHEWDRSGHPASRAFMALSPIDLRSAWRKGAHSPEWNRAVSEACDAIHKRYLELDAPGTLPDAPARPQSSTPDDQQHFGVAVPREPAASPPSDALDFQPVSDVVRARALSLLGQRGQRSLPQWLRQEAGSLSARMPSHRWLVDELLHRIGSGEPEERTTIWFEAMLDELELPN